MKTFVVRIHGTERFPREGVQYLKAPRDAAEVKREGYRFTTNIEEAWAFESEKQSAAKAKVIGKHFSQQVRAEAEGKPA
jgi:DNA-binding winged helix-turn-helix (wHTH) protein